jgi:hypothetical protein
VRARLGFFVAGAVLAVLVAAGCGGGAGGGDGADGPADAGGADAPRLPDATAFFDLTGPDDVAARVDVPAGDDAPAPRDTTQPPADATQPPRDVPPPPVDVAQPPAEVTQPPVDAWQPPVDAAQPPADVTQPPVDAWQPPVDGAQPPRDVPQPPPDLGHPPDVPHPPPCPSGTWAEGPRCVTDCAVLVVGEGLGGTAAALAAASAGADTCLVAFWPWLGGQATTQGVSALDEGLPENGVPGWSAGYRAFRAAVRAHYLATYPVLRPQTTTDGADGAAFNPGSCWVSRLCYEPAVGAAVLDDMVAPHVAAGRLRILREHDLESVLRVQSRWEDRVDGVVLRPRGGGPRLEVRAAVTLDATELGDVLALAGVPYRTGAEAASDTGEPHARAVADPECVQPFTYPFLLERRPTGEVHTIPRPPYYDPARYGLVVTRPYYVFDDPSGGLVFWTYRRLIAAANFGGGAFPTDIAMINWGPGGNDFDEPCVGGTPAGCNVVDRTPTEAALVFQRGRDIALGFVYWLQTDAPRDDGSCCGYPNLRLVTDAFPTTDGLAPYPYIREGRRLRALVTVREQDIVADGSGSRARLFGDSVGVGWYPMDLHACAAGEPTHGDPTWEGGTRPFQIPLGALVPRTTDGLLAAAKNLGVTHLTNGAYRLHPVEWQVGEAAGLAAAVAVAQGVEPRDLATDPTWLRRLQYRLVRDLRTPLFWWSDLRASDGALYDAAQMLGVEGVLVGTPSDLRFAPDATLTREALATVVVKLFGLTPVTACRPAFDDVPCGRWSYPYVQALAEDGITAGCGDRQFCPELAATRGMLAVFFTRAAGWPTATPAAPSYTDVPAGHAFYGAIETARARGVFTGVQDGATFGPDTTAIRRWVALASWNVLRARLGL